MAEKTAKKRKPDFTPEVKPVDKNVAEAEIKRINEALKEKFKDVPDAELQRGAKKMVDFAQGKIGWADLMNFTPENLFNMAELGFNQFKIGKYEDAERIFKMLTILDWNNSYFHSVMGSILQKQKRYGEAMAEYSQALELDPNDTASLTNRGEILLMHGLFDEAEADLKKSLALGESGEDGFSNRAEMLLKKMEVARKSASNRKTKKH